MGRVECPERSRVGTVAVDYSKALNATLIHPLRAFADGSGRVYVVFGGVKGKRSIASFSAEDIERLAHPKPFAPLVLHYDPTIPTRTLLALVTRNMIPSEWFKELEEES